MKMSASARRDIQRATGEVDRPFGGLFGDTAELRVLQEIIADPYSDYTHHDLMQLTSLSDPSVRRGIRVLLDHDIIRNVSSDRRSPLYRANHGSRRLTALTFFAYAALDDKTGGDSMDGAIRHYCEPRNVYIDFLELPASKRAKGTRVYVPQAAAKKLGEVLQDVLNKAGKEASIERLRASP